MPSEGPIHRKQGKIRRKKDNGIAAWQRPSSQSQSGPEDHEEAGTAGKDGKEKKEIQLQYLRDGNDSKGRSTIPSFRLLHKLLTRLSFCFTIPTIGANTP